MKKTITLSALVLAATATVAFAQNAFITIGSGSTTGVYFPVATGMAKMMNADENPSLAALPASSGRCASIGGDHTPGYVPAQPTRPPAPTALCVHGWGPG